MSLVALSYVSLADANNYMQFHPKRLVWERGTGDQQTMCLTQATRDIDGLALKGRRKTVEQALRFPRQDQETVPDDILRATILIAVEYIGGKDPEMEFNQLSLVGERYTSLSRSRNPDLIEPHIAAGIISFEAFALLQPYLRSDDAIRLTRIS